MPQKAAVTKTSAPARRAKPVDLSKVVVRTKQMNDPEIVLRWNGSKGETSVLGGRMLMDLAMELGKGSVKAEQVEVSTLETEEEPDMTESLGDIALVPAPEKTLSTLPVKWSGESVARIDFAKLFTLRRFLIPHGQVAHIPMSVEPVEGATNAVILHFTQARFAEIEARGKRGKSKTASPEGA